MPHATSSTELRGQTIHSEGKGVAPISNPSDMDKFHKVVDILHLAFCCERILSAMVNVIHLPVLQIEEYSDIVPCILNSVGAQASACINKSNGAVKYALTATLSLDMPISHTAVANDSNFRFDPLSDNVHKVSSTVVLYGNKEHVAHCRSPTALAQHGPCNTCADQTLLPSVFIILFAPTHPNHCEESHV